LLRLDFRQVTHPDDLPGDFAEIERLRRGEGEHYTRQKRYLHRDGHVIWTAVNVAVVRHPDGAPQYFTVQVEDITERRRADEALRESEARFRQLAENIQEVFYIVDLPERQMRYVSPAYDRIWGRPGEELVAEPWRWLESLHPDDRARVRQAAEQQQPQGLYDEEYRVVRPDGSVRWIHDRSFPIRDAAGEVYRVVGVAEDITARRAVEDELRQAQKMEGIGQLAGGVAHDFNNILTAILMQVELAAGEPGLPAEVAEALDGIRESARRAADLTRQLLVFSRKQVIQRRQLDLNESVLGLAKMLQRVLREDIHLEVRLAPGPLWMVGDTGMVDQVLVNLAVNARDAMPAGGTVTIETDTRLLTPEEARAHPGARPGPCVLVRVRDTGTGIPPELLSRIFEPFFTTKEPGQGTGLGLATVFGIVQQHRGALGVQSVVGQGTTFEVLFPARAAAAAPARNGSAAEARQGAGEVVLLTEDDAAIRTLIASVLTKSGYEVVTAPDGPSALERWRERGGKVDLLMTDLVMPSGMSGHELAARLRQERPGLKVLFTSGYPRDFAGKEFKLEPGQLFLPKPATPAQLLEMVRRCLEG
ncbi:MAG TPA: PAS domain S-box protein, partial [Gemmatimonadales bacterium]|nr:PAS domain S-box protein [Gemmatimonadales bacterium]